MARIALRVYNNEINDLIDHGQTEEAVAHCRHILKTFSKHVNTYRLLGKAYLEEQRYEDAADILQRVLSSIPEDFISQVGMSIIREDEGNLDTAIFHMERAFEVQPSNHAIQDELRRLYGRRDGLEPPRIRLTRGALARMYAHGHLYDQAIAELLAALSEDPQRYDLMVLLANMYFQAEKKVEATETCKKILDKLPFCLDANRLLVTILESSGREENARTFRERWEQLDPYAAALDADNSNLEFVSDQSVTVERLEWEPGEYDFKTDEGRAAWASSLGSTFEGEFRVEDSAPDWLSRRGDDQLEPSESLFGETPSEEKEGRPDRLPSSPEKESGNFDLGSSPESPVPDGESPEPFDEQDTVKPDWIGTPTDDQEKSKESPFPSVDEPETTSDWITPSDEEVSEPSGETPGEEGIPDFMKEAGWEPSIEEAEEPQPVFSEEPSSEEEDESLPGDVPEWMQDIALTEDEIVEPTPSSMTEETIDDDIQVESTPDWQQSIESIDIEPQAEIDPISAADELTTSPEHPPGEKIEEEEVKADDEEGMAWLEGLAAKQGIAEEELVTTPEERDDASPDWLKTTEEESQPDIEEEPSMEWLDQLSQEAAQEAAPETSIPAEPIPGEVAPAPDEDEGMAWLESLAAKQGIAEEELVTTPEERDDASPDWLKTTEEESQPDIEEEPSMEWLDQLSQEAAQEAAPETPIPAEPSPGEVAPTPDENEGMAWLESLAAKQGIAEEGLVTTPEEREVSSQDWSESTQEEVKPLPEEEASIEWLDQLNQQGTPEEARSPDMASKTGLETGEWLASLVPPKTDTGAPTVPPTEDEGLAWLDNLVTPQDTTEGESISDLGEADEEAPDWLKLQEDVPPPESQMGISQDQFTSEGEPSSEWLDQLSQETDLGDDIGDQLAPQEEWLAELDELEDELVAEEEMGSTPEAIDKVDEWIESLEQSGKEDEGLLEPESEEEPLFPSDILEEESGISFLEGQLEIEPDAEAVSPGIPVDQIDSSLEGETIPSTIPEDQIDDTPDGDTIPSFTPEEQIDVTSEGITAPSIIPEDQVDGTPEDETIPSIIPEDQMKKMLESESTPSIVPEWLQDVAEQRPEPDAIDEPPEWLPSIDEPFEDFGEVTPTLPEEWQPESKIETLQPETEPEQAPKPEPKPKLPLDLSEELENARQAIRDADIKKATKIYSKLIKKGKGIEEIIEDIEEALRKHPINVSLWQVLGDALMRSDLLQEALDAYSKAEDLLR